MASTTNPICPKCGIDAPTLFIGLGAMNPRNSGFVYTCECGTHVFCDKDPAIRYTSRIMTEHEYRLHVGAY